jgi:hypothetical protein
MIPTEAQSPSIERYGDLTPVIPAEYNPVVVRRAKTKPGLRPFKGVGQMRERASPDADWFPVEFLIYYDDHDKLRAFAYVRKEDGSEVPDGEYHVVDELGERRRTWKKWDGKWQVKWRHRWGQQS